MDHRELLRKYIGYVVGSEGTDFILIHDNRWMHDEKFTDEEWIELNRLAMEAKDKRR